MVYVVIIFQAEIYSEICCAYRGLMNFEFCSSSQPLKISGAIEIAEV